MIGFGLMALVRRSLRQHLLSTVVTVISVGLAVGLTMAVFAINKQTYDAFTGGSPGFDAVLVGDFEFGEDSYGVAHGFPVGFAAHDNGD